MVWLLDAALQYQPFMFAKMFPAVMLAPSGAGEPAFVSGPVLTAERLISGHIVPVNAMFATVQLALAAGLLVPATVRAALVLAAIAAMALWVTGEDFGGIFSGSGTDPNTGPLLVLIALAFWPYPRSATAFTFSRVARIPSRLVRRRAGPATLQ